MNLTKKKATAKRRYVSGMEANTMYRMKKTMTFQQIANKLDRNITTVVYNVNKIKNHRASGDGTHLLWGADALSAGQQKRWAAKRAAWTPPQIPTPKATSFLSRILGSITRV